MSAKLVALLQSAKKGDIKAFEQIVRILERQVYMTAYAIIPDPDEAMDIVQETFVKLYNHLKRIRSEAGFKCFVFKMATNCAIDRRRRLKRKKISLSEDETVPASVEIELSRRNESPDKDVERRELLRIVQSVVDELPPRQKLCLILADLDGLSKKEIAKTLGCPQGTVRSNLHIARLKLRRALKDFR
ncbi:MAG: sigma-70 family RNA polymerase sigma factor [candidate division Zixibacteria bacterium]|nr:sigma-70 family RNA polymerase sigma factor [candidate division Zixibacteria bacterium]NIR68129.1 sigma-70 family RNA polymerase sigma factor [candidate division Zixibacteria bacterium]NIS17793.1 sigma-70 family RNA polymerase sigma factor [candidate division Zixibacteria bacterium]NIS49344.1 sigma-70 family RNA polymerase sigma factor [candidate division Zixibacteria bacterium]NIT54121.1 sigma-70 family RNA polymerase sigma factor [candidate division Zixibacteria bacterium]